MDDSPDKKPLQLRRTDELVEAIVGVLDNADRERKMVAIVGAPGSGKSTLMSSLLPALQRKLGEEAVTGIPMDGFHLDNVLLDADNTRSVKGAPHTFDVGGLLCLIERIAQNNSPRDAGVRSLEQTKSNSRSAAPIYAPEFDRGNDASRNCVLKIENKHKLVLIEGNYLLLDEPIWREMKQHFSLTINIDVNEDTLKKRLINRWLHYGLSEKDAIEKALSNDIPNAKTVVEHSMPADIVFTPEIVE